MVTSDMDVNRRLSFAKTPFSEVPVKTLISEENWFDQVEPSANDLDAIEAEWPVIEAELLLLEDELDRLFPERLIEFDLGREVLREETTVALPTFSMN